ncbi:S4 domain-containing protein YaaA [Texcoconibacillus texcoconensis]|uniref:S4 domain protein YaaA n=1 Tax=Texcoconibacillus texcoconensis TaxID=1095777 RepID=A0A840QTC0_9BACI|nr:S4 domain-containing protein YaaA [Texcoconibacillus texcoconensis]MBB5174786.1 S4 domain protein YaaA [Texcoconibacillus texcoconensis]
METNVNITSSYITLGQLLKEAGLIDTGGAAKWYLQEFAVSVNGEPDTRRGRKLYPNDSVAISEVGTFVVTKE